MTMLPIHKPRVRTVPITWHNSAWTVQVVVRSAAPVFRRLSGLKPLRKNTRIHSSELHALRSGGLLRPVAPRSAAPPLRGRISSRRRFGCDPAVMSRLSAFAGLPLCRAQAPRMRIFRVFQHPQFAL
ncbi:MAG TPA: hypothetical protein VHI52_12310 [Verrucomicrobiae bacterium]|nr:hypothetical protein [Verrucomicrobiae bacterium]